MSNCPLYFLKLIGTYIFYTLVWCSLVEEVQHIMVVSYLTSLRLRMSISVSSLLFSKLEVSNSYKILNFIILYYQVSTIFSPASEPCFPSRDKLLSAQSGSPSVSSPLVTCGSPPCSSASSPSTSHPSSPQEQHSSSASWWLAEVAAPPCRRFLSWDQSPDQEQWQVQYLLVQNQVEPQAFSFSQPKVIIEEMIS